jgi:glyoxylase-like metal-dependent hydrolase (beta-lactamase superfamily II)
LVKRWDIVTIGNLSRNRYWGESEDRAVRAPLCTSTLIQVGSHRLLVDPPIAEAHGMAAELNRRTGLWPADIDAVFITHEHGDHHAGLACFPNAEWYAAPAVAETVNAAGHYAKSLRPVTGRLFDLIDIIPTPGHTAGHHSLRFDCDGLSVLIAGDATMTRDFWAERRGFFNSADPAQASRTMESLAQIADAIVPGHDNWFLIGPAR